MAAALQQSEERLRLAIEATGLGTWDVDVRAGTRRWSDEFLAIVGLPQGTRPDPELFASLIHPEDRDWVVARYQAAYSAPEHAHYQAEFRIRRRSDGAERWVLTSGQVLYDAAARPVRGIGTIMDVTARRQTEDALRHSEERLRLILDNLSEAVTAVFPDQPAPVRNRAWLRFHGFRSFDELPGLAFEDLIPLFELYDGAGRRLLPDELPLGRAMRGERFEDLELRMRRSDTGRERWASYNGTGVRGPDGRVMLAVISIRDVTDRKLVEAERARLAGLLEATPDLVAITRASGEPIYLNGAARRVLGLPAAGELGSSRPLWPDARLAREAACVALERGSWSGEGVIAAADGTEVPVSQVVLRQRDADGSVYLSTIARDISEHKAAAARQRLLLAELSHRVKNTLATVQVIAARSLAGERTLEEAREALTTRLRAMAKTHDLLTARHWRGAGLRAVLEAELKPYGQRALLRGEEVELSPKAAHSFAMVLHELVTNAAKHGALSGPEGWLEVAWTLSPRLPDDGELRLLWHEHDGPPVRPPTTRGFGRTLIEQGLRHELGGRVALEFRPGGLVCELAVPARSALAEHVQRASGAGQAASPA